MNISEEKKKKLDRILGCYVIPILIPVGVGVFAFLLMIVSRYEKAEIFLKGCKAFLKRRKLWTE
jgi:hypothetical protein